MYQAIVELTDGRVFEYEDVKSVYTEKGLLCVRYYNPKSPNMESTAYFGTGIVCAMEKGEYKPAPVDAEKIKDVEGGE